MGLMKGKWLEGNINEQQPIEQRLNFGHVYAGDGFA